VIDPAGPLGQSLGAAAGLMTAARDPWWIIGSAAVALHGGDPGAIGDIDVLASARDAEAVLARLAVPCQPGSPHPRFRSTIFARLTGSPLPIELMAGFAVATGDGWQPVGFASREAVDVGEARLFVPSVADLVALLALLGRDKDRRRAALIA
jgi:hypothetical protein